MRDTEALVAVAESEAEPVAVTVRLWDALVDKLRDSVVDREVVVVGCTVPVPEGVHVWVRLPLRLAVAGGLTVRLSVGLCERLKVAEPRGEPEAEADGEGERVETVTESVRV